MTFVSDTQTAPVESGSATYTATFELGEDGWWAAQVVEVPETISQGHTLDEAWANVADALALALELRVKRETRNSLPGTCRDRSGVTGQVKRTTSCAGCGRTTANRSRISAAEIMRRGGTRRALRRR